MFGNGNKKCLTKDKRLFGMVLLDTDTNNIYTFYFLAYFLSRNDFFKADL